MPLAQSQRSGLMRALPEQWPRVCTMLQRMPGFYAFASSAHVINAASQVLNRRLDKFFARLAFLVY